MTTINIDTSPLQAAREWRGLEVVSAALNAGLSVTQVEALEDGDISEFSSPDEMVAAAVVYGASLGIGRDEATALFDRIVLKTGPSVELGDNRPAESFSSAVRERSARISSRANSSVTVEAITPPDIDDDADELAYTEGPTPEQAVSASQEFQIDDGLLTPSLWEQDEDTGEVDGYETSFSKRNKPRFYVRVRNFIHRITERMVGTTRANSVSEWMDITGDRITKFTKKSRERLRQSEHATLFVAIGGGAILIALIVAIGGTLSKDSKSPKPSTAPAITQGSQTTAPNAKSSQTATPDTKTDEIAKTAPVTRAAMVPVSRLKVDVFNAGSQKGKANATAQKLKDAQYRVGEVGNIKDGGYATSTVLYSTGFDREASVLARKLGITTVKASPSSTGAAHITVVIV